MLQAHPSPMEYDVNHLAIRPAIGTGLLLLIPLALSVRDRHLPAGQGWHWGPLDFVVMAALLFGAGLGHAYAARRLGGRRQRWLLGAATLCVVLAIWVELAVGGISQLLDYLRGARPA